jgi:hypothetical protein
MSTETAVTTQDLELENAELLPSRETLCCWNPCRPCNPCGCFDHCCITLNISFCL